MPRAKSTKSFQNDANCVGSGVARVAVVRPHDFMRSIDSSRHMLPSIGAELVNRHLQMNRE